MIDDGCGKYYYYYYFIATHGSFYYLLSRDTLNLNVLPYIVPIGVPTYYLLIDRTAGGP